MDQTEKYDEIINKLNEQITNCKYLINEVKTLKKNKKQKSKPNIDSNRPKPFSKPVEITNDLRNFLNVEGEISRSEVSKLIYKYIKDKNLQNPDYKRQFKVDDSLSKLFNTDQDTCIEYLKVQTYLKPLFIKNE